MTHEEHLQALRDLVERDHREEIAEWRAMAAAEEDTTFRQRYLDTAARLEAIPYPWDENGRFGSA